MKEWDEEPSMRLVPLLGLAAAATAAIPAYAHHSFGAYYVEADTITVDGKVSAFLYRNPHSFVDIETTDDHGNVTKWAAEWGGSGRLSRIGVMPETFQPGDHVIITGAPGRDPSQHRVHLKTIVRPSDGLKIGNLRGRNGR
jgi:hypothetical protein